MGMLRVIAYTGGHNAPSRVPRVQHYIEPLKALGLEVRECPSYAGVFPPKKKWLRPFWGLWNLCDRFPDVLKSLRYDLSFFQREMLSTFVTWEPLVKGPRVLDVDDAIWVNRGGGFARRLAGLCDHVICGNRFLAEQFSKWNRSVSILPTSVDTREYHPRPELADRQHPIIGWMGLSGGFKFLYGIEPALRTILRIHPELVLRIVSNEPPRFQDLPGDQFEFVPWRRERQAQDIQEMTIGIMPLDDSEESRGKCSYKMLLYMACGLPVIVSPVGMNADVLQKGELGIGASSVDEWIAGLDDLIRDPEKRARMGNTGREVVAKHYSVDVLVPHLASTLLRMTGSSQAPVIDDVSYSS